MRRVGVVRFDGGGERARRYVEAEGLGGDRYELDFNRAYNPFCAYNDGWRCPLPRARTGAHPDPRRRARLPLTQVAARRAIANAGGGALGVGP
jgi:hypothetical protein